MMSASWDPDKEGSALGAEDAGVVSICHALFCRSLVFSHSLSPSLALSLAFCKRLSLSLAFCKSTFRPIMAQPQLTQGVLGEHADPGRRLQKSHP